MKYCIGVAQASGAYKLKDDALPNLYSEVLLVCLVFCFKGSVQLTRDGNKIQTWTGLRGEIMGFVQLLGKSLNSKHACPAASDESQEDSQNLVDLLALLDPDTLASGSAKDDMEVFRNRIAEDPAAFKFMEDFLSKTDMAKPFRLHTSYNEFVSELLTSFSDKGTPKFGDVLRKIGLQVWELFPVSCVAIAAAGLEASIASGGQFVVDPMASMFKDCKSLEAYLSLRSKYAIKAFMDVTEDLELQDLKQPHVFLSSIFGQNLNKDFASSLVKYDVACMSLHSWELLYLNLIHGLCTRKEAPDQILKDTAEAHGLHACRACPTSGAATVTPQKKVEVKEQEEEQESSAKKHKATLLHTVSDMYKWDAERESDDEACSESTQQLEAFSHC